MTDTDQRRASELNDELVKHDAWAAKVAAQDSPPTRAGSREETL